MFGHWMVSEGRRRVQARIQPRVQSKIGRSLQEKNREKFTMTNNPFAVLEDKKMGKEGEKMVEGFVIELGMKNVVASEMDVVCPLVAGEMEMRIVEVIPREVEVVNEKGDDKVVDEEIMIDEESGREECLSTGVSGLVMAGIKSVDEQVVDKVKSVSRSVSREGVVEEIGVRVVESGKGDVNACLAVDREETIERDRPKGKLAIEKENLLKPRVQGETRGCGRRRIEDDSRESVKEVRSKGAAASR